MHGDGDGDLTVGGECDVRGELGDVCQLPIERGIGCELTWSCDILVLHRRCSETAP